MSSYCLCGTGKTLPGMKKKGHVFVYDNFYGLERTVKVMKTVHGIDSLCTVNENGSTFPGWEREPSQEKRKNRGFGG